MNSGIEAVTYFSKLASAFITHKKFQCNFNYEMCTRCSDTCEIYKDKWDMFASRTAEFSTRLTRWRLISPAVAHGIGITESIAIIYLFREDLLNF